MSTCRHIENAPHTDYICIHPSGHAGDHDLIDAMGICGEHPDCRATARTGDHYGACEWSRYRTARENAIEHDPRCPARGTADVEAARKWIRDQREREKATWIAEARAQGVTA